jgi:hypothetical protein
LFFTTFFVIILLKIQLGSLDLCLLSFIYNCFSYQWTGMSVQDIPRLSWHKRGHEAFKNEKLVDLTFECFEEEWWIHSSFFVGSSEDHYLIW